MISRQSTFVIGFGGVTNGGKTTTCSAVEKFFSSNPLKYRVKTMHLDHYFRSEDDPHHVHLKELNHHDWESLTALHIDQFLIDFQSNLQQCDILLVEGFLIYNIDYPSKTLKDIFHIMFFFDLPYEECLHRRLRRNYNPPDPDGYFIKHVWQESIKSKQEALDRSKDSPIIVIDTSEISIDQMIKMVIDQIQEKLSVQI